MANTWEKESDIRFTDWCPCSNNFPGIHISIEDDSKGPRVKALGNKLNAVPAGMVLNFTFKKWGSALVPEVIKSRKQAIEIIGIHEFGHALGFSHQQIREACFLCDEVSKFIPASNEPEMSLSKEGLWFTPCDRFSVMNYCSNDYLNNGTLSDNDKLAVRTLYGSPAYASQSSPVKFVYTEIKTSGKIKNDEYFAEKPIKGQQGSQPMVRQSLRKGYTIVKGDFYIVRIYLVAPENFFPKIDFVSYQLDPSFGLSKYKIFPDSSNFSFSFYAWGNFPVKANIYFKDKSPSLSYEIPLTRIPPLYVKVRNRKNPNIFDDFKSHSKDQLSKKKKDE